MSSDSGDQRSGEVVRWLLETTEPAVRHATLRDLLRLPPDDPEVVVAREAAMRSKPISTILARQDPAGFWVRPGAGYGPTHRGTVWQLMFLDQLGADGADERVRRGCEYVLEHTQTLSGGFGCSTRADPGPPPPGAVLYCLHGNLLRALLSLGYGEDPRVLRAVDWLARAATGDDFEYGRSDWTTGPGFACRYNGGLPCAWGAVKSLLALARVPASLRVPAVERAIDVGARLLLSRDPSVADYPSGRGAGGVSPLWFELSFPNGYPADLLQLLEALAAAGRGADPRLRPALDWLASKADTRRRWPNELTYGLGAVAHIERSRDPSKWVTLRALGALGRIEEQVVRGKANRG